jgi:phosphopantothenoylcysteine decarboxylase/phosphopantothenate--cysteine ligase
MNTHMLEHEAVQRNLAILAARGVRFVEPGAGYLACGWIGKGRLAEPEAIVEAAHRLLAAAASWQGRHLLVTAGPTYEDLDPVRFIGNRSSGRMGFAIAAEGAARGALVTLVAGPSRLETPPGVDVVPVRSAAEMHAAVMSRADDADAVVMAAAVADYTPDRVEPEKIAKKDGPMSVTLRRTADILSDLGARRASRGRDRPLLVGFAAETEDVLARARAKRAAKRVDLIVANDVSRADAGFDVETNQVTLIGEDGEHPLPLLKKRDVAAAILDKLDALLQTRSASTMAP